MAATGATGVGTVDAMAATDAVVAMEVDTSVAMAVMAVVMEVALGWSLIPAVSAVATVITPRSWCRLPWSLAKRRKKS